MADDSLSQIPFATKAMAEDLDDHELGAIAFKYDTANIPPGASYGICIGFRATASWFWQISMCTDGNAVCVRRKVNARAWTAWVAL